MEIRPFEEPYEAADAALGAYANFLRRRIVGEEEGQDPPIVGEPVGREALVEDLALEMIPYTPEELIALGRRELAWCEAEMVAASRIGRRSLPYPDSEGRASQVPSQPVSRPDGRRGARSATVEVVPHETRKDADPFSSTETARRIR